MKPSDSVNQSNVQYIDALYQQYLRDPGAVDEHWRSFFAGFDVGVARPVKRGKRRPQGRRRPGGPRGSRPALAMGVFDLVHSYRELGHFVAQLDPLGHDRPNHPLLNFREFGMTRRRPGPARSARAASRARPTARCAT